MRGQLKAIYWFLNNTDGTIYSYQMKYLCEITNIEYNESDIGKLNDMISSGERDEEFANYFLEKEEVNK